MKKLFAVIATFSLIGLSGAALVSANEQENLTERQLVEQDCKTMAVEQNVAEQDLEQFMKDCIADLIGYGQEEALEEGKKELSNN